MLGDQAAASVLHDRSLKLHRKLGDADAIAFAATNMANAAVLAGDEAAQTDDPDRAKGLYVESLEIRRRLGDLAGIASAMEKLASVVTARDPRTAAVLLGSAERVRDLIRAPVPRAVREEYEAFRRRVQALLGDAPFEDARAEGRRLSPAAALATLPL